MKPHRDEQIETSLSLEEIRVRWPPRPAPRWRHRKSVAEAFSRRSLAYFNCTSAKALTTTPGAQLVPVRIAPPALLTDTRPFAAP
jgi:hypothetical protein